MGVEVKNVPSGIDVLSVALDFHPDIIFADILLSKKNGYEVCAEVKNNSELAKIPVVLMWSSFMEFDEKLAQRSNYNGQLEKPFDTEILRSLVNRLVAKTNSHPLKGLLEFPTIPDFVEADPKAARQKHSQASTNSHTIEEVDLDFGEKTSPGIKTGTPRGPSSLEVNNTRVDLNNPAEIQLETENYGDFEEVILVKSESSATQFNNKIKSQVQSYIENTFAKPSPLGNQHNHKPIFDSIPEIDIPTKPTQNQHQSLGSGYGMPPTQQKWQQQIDENLIREEVRVMAEKVCWQIIPDLAEKLIREELKKVMQDIEKSI